MSICGHDSKAAYRFGSGVDWRIGIFGLILVLAFVCGLAAMPADAQSPSDSNPVPYFIVNRPVIDRTATLDAGFADRYFNQPNAYETPYGTVSWAQSAPNASRMKSFADETKLQAAIANGTLPAGTQGVMLDLEQWSQTPLAQQQDPVTYYQRGAAAAHAAGLWFAATPGTDLANVVNPGTSPQWQRWLSSGLIGPIATSADLFSIQSQGQEAKVSAYTSYVSQASAQAHGSNAAVQVLSGLSTNPGGVAEPASVLLAAAQAAKPYVLGWWLNDPGASPSCPKCTGPYPQTVVDFLGGLATIGY
jgi:hypothetical protein